jgi:hypothetical protein
MAFMSTGWPTPVGAGAVRRFLGIRSWSVREALAVGVLGLLALVFAEGVAGVPAGLLLERWQTRQTATVPVPPVDASPEAVVRAFVHAGDVHDEPAVRAMAAPEYLDGYEGPPAPLGLAHISIHTIGVAYPVRGEDVGVPEVARYRQIVRVPTDLHMTDVWMLINDNRVGDDFQPRNFTLVRNADNDAWRIAEIGQG